MATLVHEPPSPHALNATSLEKTWGQVANQSRLWRRDTPLENADRDGYRGSSADRDKTPHHRGFLVGALGRAKKATR